MQVIRVLFFGDLRRMPLSPIGDLKNPSGMAGPRGFSNPLWASGDLGEDPLEKTRITTVNFKNVVFNGETITTPNI